MSKGKNYKKKLIPPTASSQKPTHTPAQKTTDTSSNELIFQQEVYPTVKPETLEGYERVYPGASEIIFNTVKEVHRHKINMEIDQSQNNTTIIKTQSKIAIREQVFTNITIWIVVIVGAILIYMAKNDRIEISGIATLSLGLSPMIITVVNNITAKIITIVKKLFFKNKK